MLHPHTYTQMNDMVTTTAGRDGKNEAGGLEQRGG